MRFTKFKLMWQTPSNSVFTISASNTFHIVGSFLLVSSDFDSAGTGTHILMHGRVITVHREANSKLISVPEQLGW